MLTYLIVIVVLALLFDFINGFHDTANAIATSISTRALSPRVAIAMAATLNFVGAMVSSKVAKTVGGSIANPAKIENGVEDRHRCLTCGHHLELVNLVSGDSFLFFPYTPWFSSWSCYCWCWGPCGKLEWFYSNYYHFGFIAHYCFRSRLLHYDLDQVHRYMVWEHFKIEAKSHIPYLTNFICGITFIFPWWKRCTKSNGDYRIWSSRSWCSNDLEVPRLGENCCRFGHGTWNIHRWMANY